MKFQSERIPKPAVSGFTFVEIVVALLLIGILGSVALSRVLDGNTYNPAIARDQLLSMIRSAQQNALGRKGVRFQAQISGTGLTLTVFENTVEELKFETLNTNGLSSLTVGIAGNCGAGDVTTSLAGDPLILEFGDFAAISGVSFAGQPLLPLQDSLRLCVNDDPAMSLCVSPSGFAYRLETSGECDA